MSEDGSEKQPVVTRSGSVDVRRGLGNVGYLLSGNALSYVLSIITVVVVARPLGPEGYGIFSVITAFVGFFSFSSLNGFDKVMVRETAGAEQRLEGVFAQVAGLKVVVGSAALVACVIAAWVWPDYSVVERVGITMASVILLCSPLMGILNAVFQTHEKMQWIAIGGLVRQVLYVALAGSLLFLLEPSPVYVVVAFVVSYVAAVAFSWRVATRFSRPRVSLNLRGIDRKILVAGLVFTFIQFVSFMYTKVDILMIRHFLTATEVGLFALAQTVFSRLNSSQEMIARAFFPQVVKRAKSGELRLVDLRGGMFALFAVALALAGAAYLLMPLVVPPILGEAYAPAIPVAQLLVWVLVVNAPFIPMTLMLQARHQEVLLAKVAPVRAVVNVGLDIVLLQMGYGIMGVAAGTIITSLLYYGVLLASAWRKGLVFYRRGESRVAS